MPTAKEMPIVTDLDELHTAAAGQLRVRVRGAVSDTGDGYSGRYRNVWLRIDIGCASVRVTATESSALGQASLGDQVDLAVSMTGMMDVSFGVYFGQRAQLIALAPPPA